MSGDLKELTASYTAEVVVEAGNSKAVTARVEIEGVREPPIVHVA